MVAAKTRGRCQGVFSFKLFFFFCCSPVLFYFECFLHLWWKLVKKTRRSIKAYTGLPMVRVTQKLGGIELQGSS